MASPAPVDFKALFEKSPGNFLILDCDFRVVAATDGYCRAARIERNVMVGRDLFELFAGDVSRPDAEGIANLRQSLEWVLRFRRADAMPVTHYDVVSAREGGFQARFWSVWNVPLLDEDGAVRWIVHRVLDMTQSLREPETDESRGRIEREQNVIIARLRAVNEELAQLGSLRAALMQMSRLNTIAMMASALAHDVSQPLTAARNYLSALRRGRRMQSLDEQKTEELLAKLSLQLDRAGEIVKGLRTFMAAGSTVHRPENVADVIGDAVKLADSTVSAAGAVLTTNIGEALAKVAMDRIQIQQCLLNLVTNAAEAMRDSPRKAIDISAEMAGGALRIAVSDTGPGLPDDVAARLDEGFSSTQSINMGLGLPICRQIVKEHHGTLTVARNRPRGTVISLTIPVGAGGAVPIPVSNRHVLGA
jgi:two-component system sensor kinase FixL